MDLFCYIWISSAIPSMPDLYDAPPVSSTYRRKFNTVSTRLQVSNSVRLGVPLGAAWADQGLSGLALRGVTSWLTPRHQPITGQVFLITGKSGASAQPAIRAAIGCDPGANFSASRKESLVSGPRSQPVPRGSGARSVGNRTA
jgi:hypothetical protein